MAEAVYILCFVTSLAIAMLLARGYRQSRARLLLWTALGFAAITINNALLVMDLIIVRSVDLSLPRNLMMLLGVSLIVFGLSWERDV